MNGTCCFMPSDTIEIKNWVNNFDEYTTPDCSGTPYYYLHQTFELVWQAYHPCGLWCIVVKNTYTQPETDGEGGPVEPTTFVSYIAYYLTINNGLWQMYLTGGGDADSLDFVIAQCSDPLDVNEFLNAESITGGTVVTETCRVFHANYNEPCTSIGYGVYETRYIDAVFSVQGPGCKSKPDDGSSESAGDCIPCNNCYAVSIPCAGPSTLVIADAQIFAACTATGCWTFEASMVFTSAGGCTWTWTDPGGLGTAMVELVATTDAYGDPGKMWQLTVNDCHGTTLYQGCQATQVPYGTYMDLCGVTSCGGKLTRVFVGNGDLGSSSSSSDHMGLVKPQVQAVKPKLAVQKVDPLALKDSTITGNTSPNGEVKRPGCGCSRATRSAGRK